MPLTFKVPDHQVAGHRATDGKLGPLIDKSGHFYKPLQQNERGNREVAFYQSFTSNDNIPHHIRKYFPIFYGTESIDASDGSGPQLHLVLEYLTSNYANPSIMDVKIGSRTWYPQASDSYINKCIKKDGETSSLCLGFRISGMQIYLGDTGYWKPGKVTQYYAPDDVRLVLRKFVSSSKWKEMDEKDPDCMLASTVYGGSSGILQQLLELKSWFENQTFYHFYSCSILMAYDESLPDTGKGPGPTIKLVDFAHVFDADGVIDHNFLGGLCSLIKFISDIVLMPNGSIAEAVV